MVSVAFAQSQWERPLLPHPRLASCFTNIIHFKTRKIRDLVELMEKLWSGSRWACTVWWFTFLCDCVMLPESLLIWRKIKIILDLRVVCMLLFISIQSLWTMLAHWIFIEVALHYGYCRHQILPENAQINKDLPFILAKNAGMALVKE